MNKTYKIDKEIIEEHGLSLDEYDKIRTKKSVNFFISKLKII